MVFVLLCYLRKSFSIMQQPLSEQELVRRKSLEELKSLGINPYPPEAFSVNVSAADIYENYERDKLSYKNVSLAGRIMSRRIMGNASFAEIQDNTGRIQVYIKRDEICPGEDKTLYNTVFKKLLDIGDIVGVEGYVFTTQTGELTIHVSAFKLLSKSLRPLPVVKTDESGNVHDAFSDPEQRYRMRYLDLIVNPDVREVFVQRTKLVNSIRHYLSSKGYLEVETPILQPIHGGAAARPFKTHHNTLDMDLFLRIANELYLKRLIVGGFDGVFEFAKDFRNEGMSRFHNPEFTQVELYVAYKDYYWMMDLVERMIEKVAVDLHGVNEIVYGEQKISFQRPFARFTMVDAIRTFSGYDVSSMDDDALREAVKKVGGKVEAQMSKPHLIDELFGITVEPKLIQPTFIMDYPVEMSPLAKKHRDKEGYVERFELICNGKELCNAYTELNDPIDQRERFKEQLELAARGDEEAMVMDEDFLRAMEFGMPPTTGLGIGIDRLTMIMTGAQSIQDVIFFPQMRPERG